MLVSVRPFDEIAACIDPFLQTAANGDEIAILFAAVIATVSALTILGSVAFEAVVSVRIRSHRISDVK